MAIYVLVPGGWSGGWTWRYVAPRIRAAGHEVFTPTLTGMGERAHLLRPEIDLDTHIADIVNTLAWYELERVVLVGHSYGGMVVTGAADRAAGRIASLVYLDAFMPENGQSLLDIMAPERRAQVETAVRERGEGWKLPRLDAPAFNLPDPAEQARLERLCTPHPFGTFRQKIAVTGAWRAIPKLTYILAKRYDPSPMQEFAARCRRDARWTVRELDCHHMVQYLKPRETAEMLLAAAP